MSYAVLMYEYDEFGERLVGDRRGFRSEADAERFAWRVAGCEVPSGDGSAVVGLACVWCCDGSGELLRPTGNEFEG
jgi:hypothetical protein